MLFSHIMRALKLSYCLLVLFALDAAAQTVQVIPPNPTTADEVFLRIDGGYFNGVVTQTGTHFRVDMEDCPILCFPTVDVYLGPLPARSYTYEIFQQSPPSPIASGAFVVAPATLPDAPTLSPAALAALCLILVGAGWFFIGRHA